MAVVPDLCLRGVGIMTAGFIHYRNYETHYRSEVERQLSAIADLKVGELVQWRKERLSDGTMMFQERRLLLPGAPRHC